MFHARQQSSTSYPIFIFMTLASDHLTPATGKTLTITLSKNGGAFAAAAGAITEIANGWYQLAANATDRNTLGTLLLYATAALCDASTSNFVIVPFDPFDGVRLGLTALPNVAAGANGGLPLGDASGRVTVGALIANVITAASITAAALNGKGDWYSGTPPTPPTAAAIATAIWQDLTAGSDFGTAGSVGKLLKDDIDVVLSTRLATAGYTTPPTAAALATQMWQDLLAGTDFSTAGSIGKLLKDDVDAAISTRSTFAGGAVASVTAGVTVTTNNDKTGYELSVAGVLAIWNQLTADAGIVVASFGKKLKDWVLGTDNKVLLSANAQTGVTIPTVTNVTNPVSVGTGFNRAVAVPGYKFEMTNAAGIALIGITVTPTRYRDAVGWEACDNAVTSVGFGIYKYDFSINDTDGAIIMYRFAGPTTGDPATQATDHLFEIFTVA